MFILGRQLSDLQKNGSFLSSCYMSRAEQWSIIEEETCWIVVIPLLSPEADIQSPNACCAFREISVGVGARQDCLKNIPCCPSWGTPGGTYPFFLMSFIWIDSRHEVSLFLLSSPLLCCLCPNLLQVYFCSPCSFQGCHGAPIQPIHQLLLEIGP